MWSARAGHLLLSIAELLIEARLVRPIQNAAWELRWTYSKGEKERAQQNQPLSSRAKCFGYRVRRHPRRTWRLRPARAQGHGPANCFDGRKRRRELLAELRWDREEDAQIG